MTQELSGTFPDTPANHLAAALAKVSRGGQHISSSAGPEQATAADLSRRPEVLRIELRTVSWAELMADVVSVPRPELALALALTVLN